MEACARRGSRDVARTAVDSATGLAAGDCSNRSARALTLVETRGEARVEAVVDAAPETDLGAGLGERTPLVVGRRGRVVAAMSGGGEASSCSVVVKAVL